VATTKQSKFKRLYTELIYQPQLELLALLRLRTFWIAAVATATP
jgi:hypothetical protein